MNGYRELNNFKMPKHNLLNQKFGKLLVIAEAESIKRVKWLCQCDCGNTKIVGAKELKNGDTKSCGCLSIALYNLKAQQMQMAKTKYHPIIAAAMYIWGGRYKDLSFENFYKLSQMNCYYCESPPSNKATLKNYNNRSKFAIENGIFIYNGIDRIDSNKDHNLNNVVPCCFICNRAKRELSIEHFFINIDNLIKTEKIPFEEHRKNSESIDISILNNKNKYSYRTSVFAKYKSGYNDGNLTFEQFYQLSQLNCYYCDLKPSNIHNSCNKNSSLYAKENGNFIYNGLDRIDCNFSHNYVNIITSCKYCNYAKQKLNIIEFYEWIDKLKKKSRVAPAFHNQSHSHI